MAFNQKYDLCYHTVLNYQLLPTAMYTAQDPTPSSPSNPMIALNNVKKTFCLQKQGKTVQFEAVKPTHLNINAQEIFGLMGYSGAGKSTLLRIINLLERPDTGSVVVNGIDLTTLNATALRKARHNIGMIFQQFNLMANRTVFDNVAFNLHVAGHPKSSIDQRVKECLDIVQLSDKAEHYPAQLSGGQKQRVGIARAIAPSPKVLLADEPTSALDPDTTRSLLSVLAQINRDFGMTIVIVTHEMHVIQKLCHRTALLHQGELLEVAPIIDGQIHATTIIGKRLVAQD